MSNTINIICDGATPQVIPADTWGPDAQQQVILALPKVGILCRNDPASDPMNPMTIPLSSKGLNDLQIHQLRFDSMGSDSAYNNVGIVYAAKATIRRKNQNGSIDYLVTIKNTEVYKLFGYGKNEPWDLSSRVIDLNTNPFIAGTPQSNNWGGTDAAFEIVYLFAGWNDHGEGSTWATANWKQDEVAPVAIGPSMVNMPPQSNTYSFEDIPAAAGGDSDFNDIYINITFA